MDCASVRSLLSAHLDGALDEGDVEAVHAHLSECARCRTRLESLRSIKHAIARLPASEEPPGVIRARVDQLRLAVPRRRWRLPKWSIAAAALLAIAVVVRATLLPTRLDRRAAELVADHLKSVPEVRPAEVSSDDPAMVARFFAEHLSFPAVVPIIPGATLLGGRLCKLEGRRVELLFYRHERQTLSLYVADRPVMPDGCSASRSHHVCARAHDQLTLVLVGELPPDHLGRLLSAAVL